MYLTDVAQDGDKWRAVVNAVVYLQVPQKSGDFFFDWLGNY